MSMQPEYGLARLRAEQLRQADPPLPGRDAWRALDELRDAHRETRCRWPRPPSGPVRGVRPARTGRQLPVALRRPASALDPAPVLRRAARPRGPRTGRPCR